MNGNIDSSIVNFYFWLFIDLLNCLGFIFAIMVFMMLRFCCRPKVFFDKATNPDQIPSTESVLALRTLIGLFVSQFIPFFVTTGTNVPNAAWPIMLIQWIALIDAISITFMIFAPWSKGPQWYLRIAPTLFLSLLILDFVVEPIFIVATTVINFRAYQSYPYETYLLYFSIIFGLRLFDFKFLIWP